MGIAHPSREGNGHELLFSEPGDDAGTAACSNYAKLYIALVFGKHGSIEIKFECGTNVAGGRDRVDGSAPRTTNLDFREKLWLMKGTW
jgi:hypothetical protein